MNHQDVLENPGPRVGPSFYGSMQILFERVVHITKDLVVT